MLVVQGVLFQSQGSQGDILQTNESLKISLGFFNSLLELLMFGELLGGLVAKRFDCATLETRRRPVVRLLKPLLFVKDFKTKI